MAAKSAWRVTFITASAQFSTDLSDEQLARVRDAAIGYWNGSGSGGLIVGSTDDGPPVLVNLDRVELIKSEPLS